ncbi:MAG TPA: DNA-processing protein DprA [Bacteroidales bacterium]|nr:DNA-processing protein DprA [Bacteroidales bacterium]
MSKNIKTNANKRINLKRVCKEIIILAEQIMEQQLLYKIGITMIPGIGDITAKKLVAYCGGVEAVFREKLKGLMKVPGIGQTLAETIARNDVLSRAEKEIKYIQKNNIKPLFYLDEGYPERLKHCEDSPVMLYFNGEADFNIPRIVAIVGTRKATEYGKKICHSLVEGLASLNVMVVSGLAYGIDIHAHRAALEMGLPTVGVLGHGLNMLYPQTHKATAEKMMKNGGLLTDFSSDSKFIPENFPKRNRIVAGLSDAVIIVEAAKEGGALITADIANSYNRDVFAFPGRVGDQYSEGCNNFIKTNRAALIQSAKDLVYIMGWEEKKEKKNQNIQKQLFVELSNEEKLIVDFLNTSESVSVDMLSLKLNLPASKTAAVLLNLEFMGVIRCLPGKIYQLA